ncbi:MAG: hypothetical protein ACLFO1_02780, partial [Spirochaetaceae bacterium]
EDTEGEGSAGVDQIFGGAPELDLSGGPRPYAPLGDRRPIGGRLLFGDRGLNYDVFRLDYRESESGIFKSLVAFTRIWAARAVLVLTETEDGSYKASYGLGVNEECLDQFVIGPETAVKKALFDRRRLALLKQPIARFKDFASLCSGVDLEVFRRTLIIPVVFRSEPAYVILSVRDNVERIKDFFDLGEIEVHGRDEQA